MAKRVTLPLKILIFKYFSKHERRLGNCTVDTSDWRGKFQCRLGPSASESTSLVLWVP